MSPTCAPVHRLVAYAFMLAAVPIASASGHAQVVSDTTASAPRAEPGEAGAAPAPGDTAVAGGWGWFALPVLFYTPETRTGVGAVVMTVQRGAREGRPSTGNLILIYTQNDQITSELSGEVYARDGAYHLSGEIGYNRSPSRFFGIGNRTSEADEEDYTATGTELGIEFEKRVGTGLYLGAGYTLMDTELTEVAPDGQLAGGAIPGSRGGISAGLGLIATYDSRDHILYPNEGSYARLELTRFDAAFASDYEFTRTSLDLRRYIAPFPSHVLALRGYLEALTGGAPPFQRLARFGGEDVVRAYYDGRYRDRHLIAAQAEYRIPVWWRFGLVGFAEAGQVAGEFDDFGVDAFHYSVGAGIRFLLDTQEHLNIRLDFAYGGAGLAGPYIMGGEAF